MSSSANIKNIRKDYKQHSLDESDVLPDPFSQFEKWWHEALAAEIDEVNAMTLATATADGIPSARIVLLKGYSDKGFIFFTNYESRKGQELAHNPKASLVFFWKELERQVRISGTVSKVSEAESDEYFLSRPAGSRLGAWVSKQSTVIQSRLALEEKELELSKEFSSKEIHRPAYWGGYIVQPLQIEFWQGRPSRLHDRIQYTKNNNEWLIERLSP